MRSNFNQEIYVYCHAVLWRWWFKKIYSAISSNRQTCSVNSNLYLNTFKLSVFYNQIFKWGFKYFIYYFIRNKIPFYFKNLESFYNIFTIKIYNMRMKQLRKWIYQILKGLKYMHQKNYVHRDLKPSNIFLDNFGDIAIGDFGVGRVISNF